MKSLLDPELQEIYTAIEQYAGNRRDIVSRSGVGETTISMFMAGHRKGMSRKNYQNLRRALGDMGLLKVESSKKGEDLPDLRVHANADPEDFRLECFPRFAGTLKMDGLHEAALRVSEHSGLLNGNGGTPEFWVSPKHWEKDGIDPQSIVRVTIEKTIGGDYKEGTTLFVQTGLRPEDLQTGDEILVRLSCGNHQLRRWRVQDGKTYIVNMFDPDQIAQPTKKGTVIFGRIVEVLTRRSR